MRINVNENCESNFFLFRSKTQNTIYPANHQMWQQEAVNRPSQHLSHCCSWFYTAQLTNQHLVKSIILVLLVLFGWTEIENNTVEKMETKETKSD